MPRACSNASSKRCSSPLFTSRLTCSRIMFLHPAATCHTQATQVIFSTGTSNVLRGVWSGRAAPMGTVNRYPLPAILLISR